jgi:uncharacterized protein YndB with AHSA1/START domain
MKQAEKDRGKVIIERSYRARVEDVWDLWTTKDGFESWWGPQGFRAEVSVLDARVGGALHYEMIADSPEMIAEMKRMGRPTSHPTRSTFTELRPRERLVITNVIDFIPDVASYESEIVVDFAVTRDHVKMVVTLDVMHSEEVTRMQELGFTSQLTKLDTRFPPAAPAQ